MKLYISGAITGKNDYMKKFAEAERELVNLGYEVINPAKVNYHLPATTTHEEYMKMSFVMLEMCDGIVMLPGWTESRGANQEYGYAYAKGKYIINYEEKKKKWVEPKLEQLEWVIPISDLQKGCKIFAKGGIL